MTEVDPAHVGRRDGFTGTRDGFTAPQEASLRRLLAALAPIEFRHGDCVGADAMAAGIVNNMTPRPRIVCHPPINTRHRAWTTFNDLVMPPADYLERNQWIVRKSEVLVAATKLTRKRQSKGGTWHTIEFAERRKVPIYVVWPDGTVSTPSEELPK